MTLPSAKEAASAELDAALTYELSLDDTSLMFDWTCLIEVCHNGDPLTGGVRGLRALATAKGFAAHTGTCEATML
eukprot:665822-Pleurochrysis_carterae.AAC.1